MNARTRGLQALLSVGLRTDGPSDAQLLSWFLAEGDEAAFRALVERHGPMILGVCRRVLGCRHDAEDALQATFLVLARRAGAAPPGQLGPWLHGVALRTAWKARAAAHRRRAHEAAAARQRPGWAAAPEPAGDVGAVLDEEVARLPADWRAAVVLCDLQGLSRRQAARRLGCPEGTLSGRLTAARRLLAVRLSRRGVTLSLAALGATVAPSLAAETARLARAADLPAPLAALTTEVIRSMTFSRKVILAMVVSLAALAGGALLAATAGGRDEPPAAARAPAAGPLTRGRIVSNDAAGASLDRFRFLAFEGFDGELGLNWRPVRPDKAHVSLTKHPGRLTLTTQRGSLHGADGATGGTTKNLFVIDNPLAADKDFTLTTCLVHFKPAKQYQQAGLLLYTDDDHYLKWTYEFNDGYLPDYVHARGKPGAKGQARRELEDLDRLIREALRTGGASGDKRPARPYFVAVAETGGRPTHPVAAPAKPALPRVWLRLRKRGNLYDCLTSLDGERFVKHGTAAWAEGGPKQLGLIAQNGGEDKAPQIEAQFEFWELRSP